MTQHLLILTLGPVQDFIKQARRTRDLWFGSHVLSELSRAAARSIAGVQGAELVFPALDRSDPELRPCWTFSRAGKGEAFVDDEGLSRFRDGGAPPVNVANKIVAILPQGADPQEVARAARAAVQALWHEVAGYVWRRCRGVLAANVDAAWTEQIDGVLEHVAAWRSFEDGGYAQARREVEDAIAGRKQLREFSAWRQLRGAVPRSSLDGGRETVLAERAVQDGGHKRFGIAAGEQLDAVSLCKRAGGNPDQFVPTPNIALARWIERADELARSEMEQLRKACKEIGVRGVQRDSPWCKALPFYADVVLESQCQQVLQEADSPPTDPVGWFRRYAGPVLARMPEPYGYLAALAADGDFMGKAIEQLTTPEQHRELSGALAEFSARAREIVERSRAGELVYAGGDDVLALLCLTDALACAQALREAFDEQLRPFAAKHRLATAPTLSVGLGIAHRTEGLGDIIALGHRAEKLAKNKPGGHVGNDRNALAILVTPRSGQERAWRANWSEGPVARLTQDMKVALPLGKVHAIEEVHRRLRTVGADALRGEVRRILAHGSDGGNTFTLEDAGLVLVSDLSPEEVDIEVRRFVDRRLVAEVFARADRSVGRRSNEDPQ
jgi:CRISPR-associated protein Cmr2